MLKAITVFCGSAENCPEKYLIAAERLGGVIARQGRRLIYGSGQCGLMGRVAKGAKDAGGVITGINVKRFADYLPYPGTDEFIMAETLPERKTALIDRGDACIALPEKEDRYLSFDSAAFHEHPGYRRVGLFRNCAYKFDTWYHMIWMEKLLGNHPVPPSPLPFQT